MGRPRRPATFSPTTWLLASVPLVAGVWALLVTGFFYGDFPLMSRDWILTFGSYNEHLVREGDTLNLALGVLLATAAILLELCFVEVSLLARLVYAMPHSVLHPVTGHAFSLVRQ